MFTFQIAARVKADRRLVLTLPPEVPTGAVEIAIAIAATPGILPLDSPPADTQPEFELAPPPASEERSETEADSVAEVDSGRTSIMAAEESIQDALALLVGAPQAPAPEPKAPAAPAKVAA